MAAPQALAVGDRGVHAAFTTRIGGVSTGAYASLNLGTATGDHPGDVRRNRQALASTLGFDPARAVVLSQVHGAHVVHVGPDGGGGQFLGQLGGDAEADASVTRHPGVALLALGADCPVVLAWANGGAVSATHAGWRGLVAGVVGNAVGAMGGDPGVVQAVIGPAIGPCCYPVDADLRRVMSDRFGSDVVEDDAVDLRLGVRRSLTSAGVPDDAIRDVGGCTRCDDTRWFSYRRDGGGTGRHAGVIWIAEDAR
jgi:polyphenol oxidase